MKRMTIFIVLLISTVCLLKGQEFYFKPGIAFHYPLTTQYSPELFVLRLNSSFGTGSYYLPITSYKNKFSLAKGFSYGGILGFKVNEYFRLEMGIDYFENKETYHNDLIFSSGTSVTDWDFKTINSTYSFVLGKENGRSGFYAKAGGILGLSSCEKKISFGYLEKAYKLKSNLSFGYLFGLEYNYSLSPVLLVTTECGIDNLYYTPREAKLIDISGESSLDNIYTYLKEIHYVSEVDMQHGSYDMISDTYITSYTSPSQRLTETLNLNCVYFKIGLVYKLRKNEKN